MSPSFPNPSHPGQRPRPTFDVVLALGTGEQREARRSMALLVVLSVLSIVSILVLAFFSQATLNRQTSFASAGQARAELLAETALDTVVGDLRDEIRAGSVATLPPAGSTGNPIYFPSTNLNLLPQRATPAGITNLYKESIGGSNFWAGSAYQFKGPVRAIAGNSTTNRSANGRYLPVSRWQRPILMTPAEAALFRPPDWVLVTRRGPSTNATAKTAVADLADSTPGNTSYVVGRYAYTAYEIGGLLDANVAGYSSQSTLTPSDIARKGSLGLVSLVGIGGLTSAQVDSLIKWRNPTAYNGAGANSYSNYLFHVANTNGFLTIPPGNQGFFTRQDLVSYATKNGITNALPFLTTFSREKNSPSWSPTIAPYSGVTESASSTNRDLANLRGTNGLPLISSRFDLDRLAWLTYKGPSADLLPSDPLYNAAGTDANIKARFGLVWDTTKFNATTEFGQQWVYTSPEGSSTVPPTPSMIKTLDQVALLGRTPDFFELLKAGILSGSLGLFSNAELPSSVLNFLGSGKTNSLSWRTNNAGGSSRLYNQVADYQVFNIGANILGQYTSDGYPPLIQTPGGTSVGMKSLPYMSAMGVDTYRPGANTFAYRSNSMFWYKFVIWNPHRNAAITTTNVGPSQFQIIIMGGVAEGSFQQHQYLGVNYTSASKTNYFTASPVSIVFTNSTDFINPTPLMPKHMNVSSPGFIDAANGTAADVYTDQETGKSIAGIYIGREGTPDYSLTPPGSIYQHSTNYQPLVSSLTNAGHLTPIIDLRFRYQDWAGNWRSYQRPYNMLTDLRVTGEDNIVNAALSGPIGWPYTNTTAFGSIQWAYPDPRDRRLGLTASHIESTAVPDQEFITNTFRVDTSNASLDRDSTVYSYNGPSGNTNGPAFYNRPGVARQYAGYYADNTTNSLSYYKDLDGVLRPGDANGQAGVNPLALSGPTPNLSRPLILNGPFRTVADLGYAYRDLPWKTLDLFSTNSADAGLLDLFGLYGGTTNELPVVAGKVNLNSASPTVLQALLSGAATDFSSTDLVTVGANTNTTSDTTAFLNALRPSGKAATILANKADLVPFFATNMPTAYGLKSQREAPVRALANVVQTRTWNLLIDVVAQAGHYTPAATDLDQFIVEGEKHYWLQVAIDRYTGEIVDQELEPVYEQ